MKQVQIDRFWRAVAECLSGSLALALLTIICFRLHVDLTAAALLYLIVIVLVSLRFSYVPSMVVSIIAFLCLDYFFIPPIFDLVMSHSLDFVALFAYSGSALIITSLTSNRKRAEEVLREQASLLNLTHDTIFVRDTSDVITYWNRAAEEFYGWSTKDAIGKVAHQLMQTTFPAPLEGIMTELRRSGHWQGELIHTKRDGTQVVVASRWALQQDKSGNPLAVLETNNDITERKRAEEGILKLNNELEQRVIERTTELEAINKELEAFTYSVSHDLRAPLRHMVGYAELFQKSTSSILDAKSGRYLTMILESAQQMGNLIDDLLSFSRIGRAETQRTVVSLEQLVHEALGEVRRDTDGRKIAWKIGALPNVDGDRSMLRLALVNLISNAVKFTRTRSHAEIEIGSTDAGKDEIVVFIKDNGVGFDVKYVKKLFGVFQRLHRADEFEGTGIGLATVQRIIHRHGGKVWAEGLVDRGATFYFSVPRTERE